MIFFQIPFSVPSLLLSLWRGGCREYSLRHDTALSASLGESSHARSKDLKTRILISEEYGAVFAAQPAVAPFWMFGLGSGIQGDHISVLYFAAATCAILDFGVLILLLYGCGFYITSRIG